MSATSEEEEEEEKPVSVNNFSKINKQVQGREKTKGNALEILEKGLQKKFSKQRRLDKLDALLNKHSNVKDKLNKALMGQAPGANGPKKSSRSNQNGGGPNGNNDAAGSMFNQP